MDAFDQAWSLLKELRYGKNIRLPKGYYPPSQQTIYGGSVSPSGFPVKVPEKSTRAADSLDYYLTLPREDLEAGVRNYALRRGDTNEIVGEFPMGQVHGEDKTHDPEYIGHIPLQTKIDPEHRGKGLYARAMMSMLSAPEIGTAIISDHRNEKSARSHRQLMDMYTPHASEETPSQTYHGYTDLNLNRRGGRVTARDPRNMPTNPAWRDSAIYHPLEVEGYGSLRQFDPGGLPLRFADPSSNQMSSEFPAGPSTPLQESMMANEMRGYGQTTLDLFDDL